MLRGTVQLMGRNICQREETNVCCNCGLAQVVNEITERIVQAAEEAICKSNGVYRYRKSII